MSRLDWALVALLSLNLGDALATIHAVHWHGATEVNPAMAAALAVGPGFFFAVKMLGVASCACALRVLSEHGIARAGLYGLTGLYALVCASHVWGLL